MNRRQFSFSFLCLGLAAGLSLASPARAAGTPEEVLTALYDAQAITANDGNADPVWVDAKLRVKFFSPDLLAALDKMYAETPEGDVPALDFDPLYDGQDFEISKLKVDKAEIDGDKAVDYVEFKNFDEKKKLKFDLVNTKSGWRVDDITYTYDGTPYTLRSLLTGN